MFCQQISLNSARTAHFEEFCLAFKCQSTAPVPFQITSLLVKSHIPLVSPIEWKIFSRSMEQITHGKSQEDLLLPHPGSLLLRVNPLPLLYMAPLQSYMSCTVTYRTVLHQCSDPAVQNKLWSQTRTTTLTKTGNQEFGSLTLLENKSNNRISKKPFVVFWFCFFVFILNWNIRYCSKKMPDYLELNYKHCVTAGFYASSFQLDLASKKNRRNVFESL